MWVPKDVIGWFTGLQRAADTNAKVAETALHDLREELAATRAELGTTKVQLGVAQNQFSWLATRVNALETERAQLIEKAYGIKTAVPEITRKPVIDPLTTFTFEDVGEDVAKQLGLPSYNS